MVTKLLPSQQVLIELLRYEPDTGNLFWRKRSVAWFNASANRTAQHAAAMWNAKWAGKPALDSIHAQGYRCGRLFNSAVLAHRVIFKILHGIEPAQIDHENHDRSDNRERNLIAATYETNTKNQSLRSDNTSGVVGVSPRKNRWFAHIRVNKKTRYLGLFASVEEASRARKVADRKFGFHPNHGMS